jgi:hypothetical protein
VSLSEKWDNSEILRLEIGSFMGFDMFLPCPCVLWVKPWEEWEETYIFLGSLSSPCPCKSAF